MRIILLLKSSLLLASLFVVPISAQLSVIFCTGENFDGTCTPFVVDTVDDGSCIAVGVVGQDVSVDYVISCLI